MVVERGWWWGRWWNKHLNEIHTFFSQPKNPPYPTLPNPSPPHPAQPTTHQKPSSHFKNPTKNHQPLKPTKSPPQPTQNPTPQFKNITHYSKNPLPHPFIRTPNDPPTHLFDHKVVVRPGGSHGNGVRRRGGEALKDFVLHVHHG